MSTFDGRIEEIPEISVDRFNGENINSTAYFLSHCHADHMKGLDDWSFHKSLVHRHDVFMYASPISIRILKGLYPSIETKLKELPLGESTLIKLPFTTNKNITVTLLPAGHCPGSVMFLFESEKTVLYTGDYRVCVSDLKKYNIFYSLGKLKKMDKVYLDTTFCKISFSKLPLRQESLENIYQVVEEWIKLSKNHIIKIALSARYGSEYLFLELAKKFGMPIHVSSETYTTYKYIPEMDKAVTLKATETQIHAGCGGKMKRACTIQDNSLVRVIIPSTLWWENYDFSKGSMTVTEQGEYRVCYSCHASFEEIKDFLLFLQPKAIEPCVVPGTSKDKEIMLNLLEDIMKTYQHCSKQNDEVKLFEVIGEKSNTTNVPAAIQTASKTSDIPEDILGSPTKNFKRKKLL